MAAASESIVISSDSSDDDSNLNLDCKKIKNSKDGKKNLILLIIYFNTLKSYFYFLYLETDKVTVAAPMECPICLQKCIHPARLPCGHIFCFLCVKVIITNFN